MKRQLGFTLVEVMVVAAIVVVLAGLVTSAFLAARRSAWDATCKANLSQLGKAIYLYLAEHDEMFPPYGSAGADGGFATREGELKQTLMHYALDDKQFYCPLDERKRTEGVPAGDVTAWSEHKHTRAISLMCRVRHSQCGPASYRSPPIESRIRLNT